MLFPKSSHGDWIIAPTSLLPLLIELYLPRLQGFVVGVGHFPIPDFGFGHGTCFGHWKVSRCDVYREALKCADLIWPLVLL